MFSKFALALDVPFVRHGFIYVLTDEILS